MNAAAPTAPAAPLTITRTEWNQNGTLFVDVTAPARPMRDVDVPAMRRTARAAIAHPDKTRSSPLVGYRHDAATNTDTFTFAVSRHPDLRAHRNLAQLMRDAGRA